MTSREDSLRLSISLPEGPAVKTHLRERVGDFFPLLWSEGDRLSLNGTMSYPLAAEDAGGRSASFSFRGSIRAPYNVLYPATSQTSSVSFPSVQRYTEGSFDPAALPMFASGDSYSDASMHHLGALIGLPFTGNGTRLKQLVVMSLGGEAISGTFVLAQNSEGAFTGDFSSREGATTANLDFPDGGLSLSDSPVTAWIGIPAGAYPKGFTALVIDTEDNAMMLSFLTKETGSHTLAPGSAILFPPTAFNPGEGVFIIDEPEDLVLLAREPSAHPEVLLVKDIDMSGMEGWTPIEGFNGIFNGAGNTISGLNAAVFGTLDGQVRNLNVHASIASGDPLVAGVANEVNPDARLVSCRITGKIAYTGTTSVPVYMGGLAAKCHGEIVSSSAKVSMEIPSDAAVGVSFIGCIGGYLTSESSLSFEGLSVDEGSSVSIVYPLEGAPQLRAGGLFGYVNAPEISFSNCSSAATFDIKIPSESVTSKMWVGGIAGHTASSGGASVRFDACRNSGSFSLDGKGGIGENNTTARPCAVGGIVGKCQITGADDSSAAIFRNCENSGDIALSSSTGSSTVFARITYLAGICGDVIAANITDEACYNSGNITVSGYSDRLAIAGHLAIVWRSEGLKTILTVTGKGETPVNTGRLQYIDGSRAIKHPVAGGVIGQVMGSVSPLEIDVKNCSNGGEIDRTTSSAASFTVAPANEASAGGIIGNIGFQTSTDNYSFVTGTVENCSNSAQITINAYAGETVAVEKTTDQSFLGGIIGFSHARNGLVTVKDCSNIGYMRLTGGNAGGIVGRIQSNTLVTGCINSGRVGEFDLTYPTSYVSTGYSISGGIVGAMLFTSPDDVSAITYSHNAGDISGCHRKAEGGGTITRPTVGGIVGRYDAGRDYAAVRYCKNSGHVRSYRAASSGSTWQYSGIISGSYSEDPVGSGHYAKVQDCGIGGFISRASWIVPTSEDGEYPYYNYIYCFQELGGDYPVSTDDGQGFAEGCLAWDGESKLPWEE